MRNTKEVEAILASIYVLNQCSDHKDKNIAQIIEYTYNRLYGANTNLLLLTTIGKKYPEIASEVAEILNIETEFEKYGYEIIP